MAVWTEGHSRSSSGRGSPSNRSPSASGRDRSTVGYWVKKHGLEAVNREKQAARGGLDKDRLEALVREGRSVAWIAKVLDVSEPTVRYWLKKFDLHTRGSLRRRRAEQAKRAGLAITRLTCRHHGFTDFWLEGRGYYRCLQCRSEAVAKRRRKVKAILIREAGGRCRLCGYDRSIAALEFHHIDRSAKAFGLSYRGSPEESRSSGERRASAFSCVRTAMPK
jgi:predicted Zn-ribbon and HTH transcriptional regulator